jgi:hypothetical protein
MEVKLDLLKILLDFFSLKNFVSLIYCFKNILDITLSMFVIRFLDAIGLSLF